MLIARQKIVEKIVRNDLGQEFKVVFLVYEEAGQIKGRILSATPLETPNPDGKHACASYGAGLASRSPVLALSGNVRRQVISQIVKEYKRELIPSPFKSLLYFNL